MPHLSTPIKVLILVGCVLVISKPAWADFWDPLPGRDELIHSARAGYPEAQITLARTYIQEKTQNSKANAAALLHLARTSGARDLDREIAELIKSLDRRSLIQAHNAAVILYTRYNHPSLELEEPGSASDSTDSQKPSEPELLANGSGTVISQDGLVLTAAHVLPSSADIRFRLGNATFTAELISIDRESDLALLKINAGNLTAAPLSLASSARLGMPVFTVGFPNIKLQGFSPKLNRGEISSLAGYQDDPNNWQISVPVSPGNSGGALFDNNGNIIGVVVSKLFLQSSGHVSYAVTSKKLSEFLKDHPIDNKSINDSSSKFEEIAERTSKSCGLVLSYEKTTTSQK